FLLQLVFLPVFIIWAIAWLSGAGFSIGTGSLADPIEPLLGPLPAVPIFGAIPQGLGDWSILSAVIIIISGTVIGILFGKLPEFRNPTVLITSSVVILASLILLMAMVALAVLSSGSIGPGRMDSLGVSTWPFAWILAAEMGAGVLFGLLLRRIPDYKDLFVKEKTVSVDETETVEIKLSPATGLSDVGTLEVGTVEVGTVKIDAADDTNETEDLSRIADPTNDKQKPWFHKGSKEQKLAQPLTEEQLLEEYSWESLKLDEENMQTRDDSVD
ncbi:MAG TPA: DUF6350 family protein, partial [Microbacteriaceae bacterium]|nr:DUF6350 family protein [Microbacteriaceae bacterium]